MKHTQQELEGMSNADLIEAAIGAELIGGVLGAMADCDPDRTIPKAARLCIAEIERRGPICQFVEELCDVVKVSNLLLEHVDDKMALIKRTDRQIIIAAILAAQDKDSTND